MKHKLSEILVCPQCYGEVQETTDGILCNACRLKFPVRDNIPVMLVEEAVSLKGEIRPKAGSVSFKIISGPNKGLFFHLEKGTCKVIGRNIADPNKTTMFHVDVALSMDEGTKGLVQKYISKQFKKDGITSDAGFKRTSDVILDDSSISRLHAMLFYDETGIGVLDMVSKNGTFVNGEEIESKLLRKGDTIELGETKIVYEG